MHDSASPSDASPQSLPESTVPMSVVIQLARTKSWTRFMAVFAFTASAVAIAVSVMNGRLLSLVQTSFAIGFLVAQVVLFFAFAVLALFCGIHLIRFSKAADRTIASRSVVHLQEALKYQHRFWRLCAIIGMASLLTTLISLPGILV